jgi:short-subunit dehydrogenase
MNNYLITAGNSPLGYEIAKYLSKENNVVVTSRGKEYDLLDNVTSICGIDLLSPTDLNRLATRIKDIFKSPFTLINCSGNYQDGQEPFLETSIDKGYYIMQANYTTVYNAIHSVLPIMIANGGGNLISFSCHSVRYNYPLMLPFSAAKAAFEALTAGLSNEFSKDNIVANTFSLSTVDTEHERKIKPYGDHKNWLKPQKIAVIIEDLINSNSYYLNGNVIKLFKYSDSFFHQSYFERIKR